MRKSYALAMPLFCLIAAVAITAIAKNASAEEQMLSQKQSDYGAVVTDDNLIVYGYMYHDKDGYRNFNDLTVGTYYHDDRVHPETGCLAYDTKGPMGILITRIALWGAGSQCDAILGGAGFKCTISWEDIRSALHFYYENTQHNHKYDTVEETRNTFLQKSSDFDFYFASASAEKACSEYTGATVTAFTLLYWAKADADKDGIPDTWDDSYDGNIWIPPLYSGHHVDLGSGDDSGDVGVSLDAGSDDVSISGEDSDCASSDVPASTDSNCADIKNSESGDSTSGTSHSAGCNMIVPSVVDGLSFSSLTAAVVLLIMRRKRRP